MAMTVYGLDWVNGGGLNYAYTDLADAKLDVFECLLNSYINSISYRACNIKDLSDELAIDSESIMVDELIEDMVYITQFDVHDSFKPST